MAETGTSSAPDRYDFPDKNVLIDAAEAIFAVWMEATSVNRLGLTEATAHALADEQQATDLLKQHGLGELAARVRSGHVPLEALQAKARGADLLSVLAEDPSPPWLNQVMQQHPDDRVRDLATAAASGAVVITTEVLAESQFLLSKKGIPSTVTGPLLRGLVKDAELIEVDRDLAISSGALEALALAVRAAARENLAAIDDMDADGNLVPGWFLQSAPHPDPPPTRAAATSWREHKIAQHGIYGVDGEDLFLLYQVTVCADELGVPVRLTTSDYHAATAASRAGVCPSTLYSRTEHGIQATDASPRHRVRVLLPERAVRSRTRLPIPVREFR